MRRRRVCNGLWANSWHGRRGYLDSDPGTCTSRVLIITKIMYWGLDRSMHVKSYQDHRPQCSRGGWRLLCQPWAWTGAEVVGAFLSTTFRVSLQELRLQLSAQEESDLLWGCHWTLTRRWQLSHTISGIYILRYCVQGPQGKQTRVVLSIRNAKNRFITRVSKCDIILTLNLKLSIAPSVTVFSSHDHNHWHSHLSLSTVMPFHDIVLNDGNKVWGPIIHS